jgi:phenylacetate-CoA ligase
MGLLDRVCRGLIHPLWARHEDSRAVALRRELGRRQFDPPQVVRARQRAALRRLLRHADATVSYYRALFASVGVRPEDITTEDDFRALPVLTKSDIRRCGKELMSEAYRGAELRLKQTSGSTGVPLEVWQDARCWDWKRACTLRSDEWSGWQRGQRVAKLWGVPSGDRFNPKKALRAALYERTLYLNTLKIGPADMDRYAAKLRRLRPELLHGHAHSVFLLADHLHRTGQTAYRPCGIITTAMVLHDWQRRRIEQVFGCPVTNRYGCEEVSLIACECSEHRGMHVNADGILLEIVAGDRPARPGEEGAVVVTDLSNFAMPLIRYQIGDVAVASDRTCPCGRGLPLLESVVGREADYVVTPVGDLVSGISLTDHFASNVPGLAQLQIVQEEVSKFLFRMVRDHDFTAASEQRVAELVMHFFGPNVKYRCEFVDRIPQEPSGKYRFCISHVHAPQSAPGGRVAA